VHLYDPIIEVGAFRAVILGDFVLDILLIVADSGDQVQTTEWFKHRCSFLVFLNLVAVFVDWLIAVSTHVSLPLRVGGAINWVLEKFGGAELGLIVWLQKLNHMSQRLAVQNAIAVETVVP
jgi:hypothetical protein